MKIFSFILLLTTCVWAQEKKEIYQYKKYEKFDLGNLEVQGELLAPGDISVQERERQRLELDLYHRKDSEDLAKKDLENLH
jgi:hypothetical protein